MFSFRRGEKRYQTEVEEEEEEEERGKRRRLLYYCFYFTHFFATEKTMERSNLRILTVVRISFVFLGDDG